MCNSKKDIHVSGKVLEEMFFDWNFWYIILTVGVSTVASHLNPEIHTVVSCEYSIVPVLDGCVALLVNISCVSEVTAL